jgi:Alr-MurF fusion protein
VYRSMLKPETKIMVMVKAFSYGSGSFEIAGTLQYHQVDYLAVAYADEGKDLRQNGIELPIMVMNPDVNAFPLLLSQRLEPEIYSMTILRDFISFVKQQAPDIIYNIHLKIDTGMHRLGFQEEEIQELIQLLKENPQIEVASVFSHLSAADSPNDDDFTKNQISMFSTVSDKIEQALSYPILKHILNSTGIARFPEAQFDMVRLGIGLYGIDESGKLGGKLENVNTFKSSISQIRMVKKGESIGYSRAYRTEKDMKIATIGVGYADGFSRAFGKGVGSVLIKGKEVKIIGNICMDMCMVDVSNMEVSEGEEVIIFGKDLPVDQIAARINSIPYEMLTSISSRVKRIYFKE